MRKLGVVGCTFLVGVLAVASVVSGQGATPKAESGSWEGDYLGATGERGKLKLALEVKEAALKGTYWLQLETEDTAAKPITGKFDGKVDGEKVTFEVALGAAKEKSSFEGRLASADPYARQALFGEFKAGAKAGVWIVWRFAPPK
ncbi:MAG: hypothetical protein ACAI25_09275 [Planctomycetota bacterium]